MKMQKNVDSRIFLEELCRIIKKSYKLKSCLFYWVYIDLSCQIGRQELYKMTSELKLDPKQEMRTIPEPTKEGKDSWTCAVTKIWRLLRFFIQTNSRLWNKNGHQTQI